MPCRIEVDWELPLFLGCTEAERREEQQVAFSLKVTSPRGFQAGITDALADTLDVEQLRHTVSETARGVRPNTLEYLGALLESALRARFGSPGFEWELAMRKPRMGWTYVQAWTA